MDSNARRSASVSAAMATNSAPRWLTSTTDAPTPRQSSISSDACRNTDSGSVAGPALKLNARIKIPTVGAAEAAISSNHQIQSNNNPLNAPASNTAASNNQGKRQADARSCRVTTTTSGECSIGSSPRLDNGASTTNRWW